MADHMDFRDIVHATQSQMLKQFGDNVFQGRIIEVHLGTLLADQAFTFTDWTAEMKAKASICISEDDTLIESLVIAIGRIQSMIDKGMDNSKKVLHNLIEKANNRIEEVKSGKKPPIKPDKNAKYYADQDCCWLYEQSEFNTDKISNFISNLIKDKTDYFIKRQNLNKISYENSWNNINEKLINLLNEN